MPQGLFEGLISGLAEGLGTGALEHEQREYQERQDNKKARLQILQHAFDSGKLDEKGEDAALQELLGITMGGESGKGGGKAGGKKVMEAQKFLHATLLPIKLLRKISGKGGGKEELPAAPQRSGEQPPAQAPAQQQQPQQGGMPAPIKRTAPPFHVMSEEDRRARDQRSTDEATRHKLNIENDIEDAHQKKLRDEMPAEQQEQLDSTMKTVSGAYQKYFGKEPDAKTKERIFEQSYEKAFGVKPPIYRAPQQLGNVRGEDYGLAPGLYKHTRDQDGNDSFDKIEEHRPTASEQRMKDEMDEIRAANPKMAGASDEEVRKEALVQRSTKRRLQMVNLQTTIAGKELSTQVKKDLQDGKITPATARAALSSTSQTAKVFNADPNSEFFLKGVDVIQKSLLEEAGFDYTELLKATGGKNVNTPKTPASQDPDDPMGILPKKKK